MNAKANQMPTRSGSLVRLPLMGARGIPEAAARSAFSLVELLVVVVVIGLLASVAIPNIINIIAASKTAKDQRNAQTIASVAAAARAAGFEGWGTKSNAITNLLAGVYLTNTRNPAQVMVFRIDSIPPSDQNAAAAYLSITANSVIYVPEGGQ